MWHRPNENVIFMNMNDLYVENGRSLWNSPMVLLFLGGKEKSGIEDIPIR